MPTYFFPCTILETYLPPTSHIPIYLLTYPFTYLPKFSCLITFYFLQPTCLPRFTHLVPTSCNLPTYLLPIWLVTSYLLQPTYLPTPFTY